VKLAVVILAGGEGARMGGGKPLRLLGGRRLIDHAEAQACQWSKIIAVAVRKPAQVGLTQFPQIMDDEATEGPLAGLAAALRFGRDRACEAVLTIAADMPFLPPDLGQRLSSEIELQRAAIASSGGKLHPVCGLWRLSSLAALPDYLATGKRSLRGFAETVGFRQVDWPIALGDPFLNVNSAGDLARAEAMLKP
jgi:molybdopterin-guanine dinucleotide biosynthesis protein A